MILFIVNYFFDELINHLFILKSGKIVKNVLHKFSEPNVKSSNVFYTLWDGQTVYQYSRVNVI